jgi:hypothetical protein
MKSDRKSAFLRVNRNSKPAESTIDSIMLIARTESGVEGRFWFKAATAGVVARNATLKVLIGTTATLSHVRSEERCFWTRAFGCRARLGLLKPGTKGKHTPRAVESINVGFAINTSAWSFYIPEIKKIMSRNQVKFSEHEFPFLNRKMIPQ